MKKFALFAALTVLCALFSGCEPIGEVQRRIVVHAIGIDPAEGGFEVSYEIFSGSEAPGGGPVDASESTVVTLLALGRTLFEAEESLRLQTGKEIFLGDVELIVISEEAGTENIADFLRYFRKSDVYLGTNVVFCRGRAKEIVGAKLKQGSATAILLRGVIERAIEGGRACSSRIIEISNALSEEGEAAAVPILTLERGEETSEDSTVSDLTVGVFDSLLIPSGELSEISETETMGIRLLRGDARKMSLEVAVGEKIASVRLEGIKISRRAEIFGDTPHIFIEIEGSYETEFSPGGVSEEEIQAAAEKQLLELCERGLSALKESGADFIGLGKLLYRYAPEYAAAQNGDFSAAIAGLSAEAYARLRKY